MSNHCARFKVSGRLLRQILMLPEGSRVIDLRMNFETDCFELKVAGDESCGLPAVQEGEQIPLVSPTYEIVDGKDRFVGWGPYA